MSNDVSLLHGRLVKTDISLAGASSSALKWHDVIPQHGGDLLQWATALKVSGPVLL